MPFGMILFLFANMGSIQNLQMRNHIYDRLAPPPFNTVLLKTVQDHAFYQLPVKQKTDPVQCKFVMYL